MSKDIIFPTQEIGSIAKPSWRVKGVNPEGKIVPKDIQEAEKWGKFLDVPSYKDLISILKKRAKGIDLSQEERDEIRNYSVRYVLALFAKTNLDRVYSGEQWRVEMYEHLVRHIPGFKLLGSVHSFDYKYFTKGAIVDAPKFSQPIHLEEFEFIKKNTDREIKIPITGPYTVVDWSFNEYYENQTRGKISEGERIDLRKTYFEARRNFILDLVRNVLRPEVNILIENGATWIQIDEPAITTRPDEEEMGLYVEATNELTRGFSCTFSVHNCYSDYALLARYAPKLKDVTQLALEFANRDSSDLGVNSKVRRGYNDIKRFEDEGYRGGFGLGVTHIHDYTGKPGDGATLDGRNIIESSKLVRDRILYAAKLLKDPSRISVNPDCGLRTRSWEITFKKLQVMDEGTKLARAKVGA